MPLSGRPLRTTGAILSPRTSSATSCRPRQVRTGLAAHRVAPVAEAALRGEHHGASLHLLGRIRLRRRGLRRPLRCRAAGAALPLVSSTSTRWRLRAPAACRRLRRSGRRHRRLRLRVSENDPEDQCGGSGHRQARKTAEREHHGDRARVYEV